MIEITKEQLQENFPEVLDIIFDENERFMVVEEGRVIAAVISPADLLILQTARTTLQDQS